VEDSSTNTFNPIIDKIVELYERLLTACSLNTAALEKRIEALESKYGHKRTDIPDTDDEQIDELKARLKIRIRFDIFTCKQGNLSYFCFFSDARKSESLLLKEGCPVLFGQPFFIINTVCIDTFTLLSIPRYQTTVRGHK
jgi:hypothetical protein